MRTNNILTTASSACSGTATASSGRPTRSTQQHGRLLGPWEAGGTKFAGTDGLLIRANNVHHNTGPGLWTDINNIRTTIEHNVVHANTSHGIFHEISYRAVIRDNQVTDNGRAEPLSGWGGAGIRVAASPDVEIHGNVLAGNQNAIMLVQQEREDCRPRIGPPHPNIEVRDNDVTLALST